MTEKRYHSKHCPYCATPYKTPTKYCETCGAEKLWTIKELGATPYPWSPKTSFFLTILSYGLFTLLIFTILFYYMVFLGIPFNSIFTVLTFDPLFMVLLTFSELVFILVPIAYVFSLKVSWKTLGFASGGLRTLFTDVSLGLLVGSACVPLIVALAFNELFGSGTPTPPPGPTDLFWVGMTLVTIILIVAPAEEVLFRGFLQNSLDAHYGRIGGVLVASVIFGVVHANPLIGVYQTIVGIFLGLLFQWRGRRLVAPIAAHAIYDCIIILLNAFVF
ncbi:MAG: lysostaphin resistance A-like protein [Candidatus Hodarchaeota archaeon]